MLKGLLPWTFGSRGEDRLDQLAQRVAERSRVEVSRRICGVTPEMSPAEIRGYIRARSAVVVHREVNLALQRERHLSTSERTRLIEMATEMLVRTFTPPMVQSQRAPGSHSQAA
jgi:hypothetical protein